MSLNHIRPSALYAWQMDLENLPPQVRGVLRSLGQVLSSREPAIRAHVQGLRVRYPHFTNDQLASELIRSTRNRVAATGALSGAIAVAPGLGTLAAFGTATSQALYALEQEVELVFGIATIYGHEIGTSDERLIEAIVVVGIASGAVKVRDELLVVGGERIALAAFQKLPSTVLAHGGGRILSRILGRLATSGLARTAARVIPFAVGIAAGAGFDWLTVTGLGKVAMRYYRAPRPVELLPSAAPEYLPHVVSSD